MKINLYCDVLLVPPSVSVEEGSKHVAVERFVKTISLPSLLVPGQTYQMLDDPVTGNPCPCDFEIMDSGVFEDGTKQTSYMVVKDDYWLSFERWFEHQASEDETKLPRDAQVSLWLQEHDEELVQVKWRFQQRGWATCSGKRGPTRSRPN